MEDLQIYPTLCTLIEARDNTRCVETVVARKDALFLQGILVVFVDLEVSAHAVVEERILIRKYHFNAIVG